MVHIINGEVNRNILTKTFGWFSASKQNKSAAFILDQFFSLSEKEKLTRAEYMCTTTCEYEGECIHNIKCTGMGMHLRKFNVIKRNYNFTWTKTQVPRLLQWIQRNPSSSTTRQAAAITMMTMKISWCCWKKGMSLSLFSYKKSRSQWSATRHKATTSIWVCWKEEMLLENNWEMTRRHKRAQTTLNHNQMFNLLLNKCNNLFCFLRTINSHVSCIYIFISVIESWENKWGIRRPDHSNNKKLQCTHKNH